MASMLMVLMSCQRAPEPAPRESKARPRGPLIYVLGADPKAIGRVKVPGVEVLVLPTTSGPRLAGLTDDANTIGAITIGGGAAIEAAREALETSQFPVIELIDDLYDRGSLGQSVFQSAIPHSWQAFRLARYFGPSDRGYSKVGLAREPSDQAVADVMSEALSLRGVAFVDAPGSAEEAIKKLRQQKPQAVVIEGSLEFRSSVASELSKDPTRYAGKAKITDGWRPQLAGFDSLLQEESALAPGSVASSDYERANLRLRIEEAVGVLAKANKLADLEKFDRVRLGHLPISLGPTDHVLAERDVLGLFTIEHGKWTHLMKTFTSDLERTNILEEDWAKYFDGTTPGGEAPFYHGAKVGSVADPKNDLH
ncbi:MAG: hypothetical protein ABIS18_09120 [Actinomycetota bacterium]